MDTEKYLKAYCDYSLRESRKLSNCELIAPIVLLVGLLVVISLSIII